MYRLQFGKQSESINVSVSLRILKYRDVKRTGMKRDQNTVIDFYEPKHITRVLQILGNVCGVL